MLLKIFSSFIQDGMMLLMSVADQIAFFHGVNLIQNLTLLVCFVIGPWQFIPILYRRKPTLHFALGNVYVMLVLILSAPTLIVSAFGEDGILKILYVLILGAIWWWTTRRGIFYISNKKWLLHLKWMIGSYLTLINIVVLKLVVHFQAHMIISYLLGASSLLLFYALAQSALPQKILKSYLKME
ncbi:MAG TPA: DUF2306 domain-containing protein [Chitinophagales bacterium]|nr:DUF2306 domain-containing protein [Chitinophagales bacterium]